ncbi:hypothetical protein SynA1544_01867 [Synechococcus sp. A15-44]|jgi:hypothetical protein|nr:hypothetical protein SynA1544_01867 [Synechococcus sp. A15-44]QNI89561.1 hypothetical protein SynROS8604_02945 [Synechococcus sp. ROS8604]
MGGMKLRSGSKEKTSPPMSRAIMTIESSSVKSLAYVGD